MEHENLRIEIAGEEIRDAYPDLLELAVELDDELAALFRLRLATRLGPDGGWRHLDDEVFAAWNEVTVAAGFGAADELISGYVTHVRPVFAADAAHSYLEVWGLDRSVVMDREERLKDWPNKKDSDVAGEILNGYGFTPEVTDTEVVHDEAVSTVVQRETDMRFLKRLAARNGFECWVEGTTGYFGPPRLDAEPQPTLAVHFGGQTTVRHLALEVDALSPAGVAMFQLDRAGKEVLEAAAEPGRQAALGAEGAADLLPSGIDPARRVIAAHAATGSPEMTALCQGAHDRGEWFLSGEGEVAGNLYGHLLRPRRTVTLKGIGETYSGVYYVSHVTHAFTPGSYLQRFRVRRNALLPTGDEDFSTGSEGGLL